MTDDEARDKFFWPLLDEESNVVTEASKLAADISQRYLHGYLSCDDILEGRLPQLQEEDKPGSSSIPTTS